LGQIINWCTLLGVFRNQVIALNAFNKLVVS